LGPDRLANKEPFSATALKLFQTPWKSRSAQTRKPPESALAEFKNPAPSPGKSADRHEYLGVGGFFDMGVGGVILNLKQCAELIPAFPERRTWKKKYS